MAGWAAKRLQAKRAILGVVAFQKGAGLLRRQQRMRRAEGARQLIRQKGQRAGNCRPVVRGKRGQGLRAGKQGLGRCVFGQNDGVFAVPVEGASRGVLRQFLSGVPGGEVCGPEFVEDGIPHLPMRRSA